MIVFPIRSCARPEFVRARRGRGFFSTQRWQICVAELGPCSCRRRSSKDLWRLGFIYTEFADSWRLDFIYTEIADTLVLAGLARRWHCFFHPRCKQNFVVVFVSFFLELESIGTRKFKIVKMRGIYPRCKQNLVVVFVSFFLELESIGTRAFKNVKIWSIYPRCSEIASSFWCRFFLSQNR